MVGELDTSALGPGAVKSLRDLQVQNALENQKITAGNTANESAANILATQVLSAASSTGNQDLYDSAKQHLAAAGHDISSWAPDVTTGAQQAQAARLAQSPLGSLLNAQTKMTANDTQAVATYGSMDSAIKAGYKPEGIPGLGGYTGAMGGAVVPPVVATAAAPKAAAATPAALASATAGISPDNPGMTLPTGGAATPASALPDAEQSAQPSGAQQQMAAVNTAFTNAKQRALESAGPEPVQGTQSQAAFDSLHGQWQQKIQQAIENDPELMRAKEAAKATGNVQGTTAGDAQKAFNVILSNIPAVVNRTNQIIKYAPDASHGLGTDAEGEGVDAKFANTAIGQVIEPRTAQANAAMNKLASQESYPGITAALSNNNMKGNRFVEMLLNNALSLDMRSPPPVKTGMANQNLTNYIQTALSTAAQIRSQGFQTLSDEQIIQKFKDAGATIPDQLTQGSSGASSAAPAPATASGWSYGGVVK